VLASYPILPSSSLSANDVEKMWPALEGFPLPVLRIGGDGIVTAANGSARALHGSDLIGTPCARMCAHYPRRSVCAAARCPLASARADGAVVHVEGARHTRRGVALFNVSAIPIREGGLLKIQDPLAVRTTQVMDGIFGRGFFLHVASCTLVTRGADASTSSLLLVDVDGLKRINDRCGHAAGDAAIARIGGAIRATLGVEAIAGRWGGDEFCLLLPDADSAVAVDVARRLCERVAVDRLPDPWHGVRLSVSVGIHSFCDRMEIDRAVAAADVALYRAKRSGGGTIRVSVGSVSSGPTEAGSRATYGASPGCGRGRPRRSGFGQPKYRPISRSSTD